MIKIRTTPQQRSKIQKAFLAKKWNDEPLWTYVVAHLLASSPQKPLLLKSLIGSDADLGFEEMWFEAEPLSPRAGSGASEGNTKLDLAIGDIAPRGATGGGIEFRPGGTSWVNFTEAKVLSDCDCKTTHDPTRNQITRVIESLLTFQANGQLPASPSFTLLTPRAIRDKYADSRFYSFKYRQYQADKQLIVRDIGLSRVPERSDASWCYPADLPARLDSLRLHWAAYEDFFEQEDALRKVDVLEAAQSRVLAPQVIEFIGGILAP